LATLCFDLDGTLCTATEGAYERADPVPWAIARVNGLRRQGHRIIVFTARGTATGIDWEPLTRVQLARWGVAYDELRFGKPSADVFIDDRAVHADSWRAGDAFRVPGCPVGQDHRGDVWSSEVLAPSPMSVAEVGRTFGGCAPRLELHAGRARALATAAGWRGLPRTEKIVAAVSEALPAGHDVVFTIRLAPAGDQSFLGLWKGAE
jgi:hypothetical protein